MTSLQGLNTDISERGALYFKSVKNVPYGFIFVNVCFIIYTTIHSKHKLTV